MIFLKKIKTPIKYILQFKLGNNFLNKFSNKSSAKTMPKKIVLSGGCFWGMEDLIRKQPGVIASKFIKGN